VRWDAIAPRSNSTMTMGHGCVATGGPDPGDQPRQLAVVHERHRELVDETEAIDDP